MITCTKCGMIYESYTGDQYQLCSRCATNQFMIFTTGGTAPMNHPVITQPRDAYDLAEMIVEKVQSGTWTAQAVADAIERLYEARDAKV